MVGVPRSKGCRNCRRKKKGCDLSKPVCGPCARLNLTCGWDEKNWLFVSEDPGRPTISGSSDPNVGGRNTAISRRALSAAPAVGRLERSLSRTAFEVEWIGTFWADYLPKDDRLELSLRNINAAPATRTLQDLAYFDPTVRLGLKACALAMNGRARSDRALLREGTRVYAETLRETNKALQDPLKAQSDAVLASCKVLAMYENFRGDDTGNVSTQGHDWHRHVDGTCRIIELRGPEKHMTSHGHALFEDCRISAVISGITRRSPNFFTGPAWHSIPWETSPRHLRDELFDVMIGLPDLLRKQDDVLRKLVLVETYSDRFSVLTEARDHISRCILLATCFREWEDKALRACTGQNDGHFEQAFAGPLTLAEVCKNHGYGFFNIVMQYWTATLILHGTTWIAYRNALLATDVTLSSTLPALVRLPTIPAWMTPRPIAANIAKYAHHYFSDSAGLWGAQSASFPLGGALHYFAATGGQGSEDIQKIRQLFVGAKYGKVTGDFLRSVANTAPTKRGDTHDRMQHYCMASSWYGIDLLLQRRNASTTSVDSQAAR